MSSRWVTQGTLPALGNAQSWPARRWPIAAWPRSGPIPPSGVFATSDGGWRWSQPLRHEVLQTPAFVEWASGWFAVAAGTRSKPDQMQHTCAAHRGRGPPAQSAQCARNSARCGPISRCGVPSRQCLKSVPWTPSSKLERALSQAHSCKKLHMPLWQTIAACAIGITVNDPFSHAHQWRACRILGSNAATKPSNGK